MDMPQTIEEAIEMAQAMTDAELSDAVQVAVATKELVTIFRERDHRIVLNARAQIGVAREWMKAKVDSDPATERLLTLTLRSQAVVAVERMVASLAATSAIIPSPMAVQVLATLDHFGQAIKEQVTDGERAEVQAWINEVSVEDGGAGKSKLGLLLQAQNVVTSDMILRALDTSVEQIELVRSVARTVEGL